MNDILKIIMYLALAMVVIYLFVTISTGVEPITLIKRLGQTFEAGKIGITNAPESIASVDCRSDRYVVTLDSPKFYYKEKSGEKVLDFIVVLDFERFVYIGKYGDQKAIRCELREGEFKCPEVKLEFDIGQRTTAIEGKQNLHFTTWRASGPVTDAASSQGETLDKMLERFYNEYLSSFDVIMDFTIKCKETACKQKSQSECIGECYWEGRWSGCNLCPKFTECKDYWPDQCNLCPAPKALGCRQTILGCVA